MFSIIDNFYVTNIYFSVFYLFRSLLSLSRSFFRVLILRLQSESFFQGNVFFYNLRLSKNLKKFKILISLFTLSDSFLIQMLKLLFHKKSTLFNEDE